MLIKIVIGLALISVTELCLLVGYAMRFGIVPLLVWCTSTGLLGMYLTKRCGTDPWVLFKKTLWQGNLPDAETLNNLVLLLAGVILVIPGIALDLIGLVLLMPGTRKFILILAPGQIAKMMEQGDIRLFEWRSEEESSDESRGAIS